MSVSDQLRLRAAKTEKNNFVVSDVNRNIKSETYGKKQHEDNGNEKQKWKLNWVKERYSS